MKTRVHLSPTGPSGPSVPGRAGAGREPRRENVSTRRLMREIRLLIRIMTVLRRWKCQKVVMRMFVLFGRPGQIGQNAPKLAEVELGKKFGNVFYQRELTDVLEIPRWRRSVMHRNVQFGLHGPSGQNVPRLVMEDDRGGTGSVSCQRGLDCFVLERMARRGTVTSTSVQSGLRGQSGLRAPRRVEEARGHH